MKLLWVYMMSLAIGVAAPVSDYATAIEQAKASKRGVVVLIHGSDWNIPGEVLYKSWQNEKFQKSYESQAVLVAIDKKEELSAEDVALAKKNEGCPVTYRTLPAIAYVDSEGRVAAVRAGVVEIKASGGLEPTVQAMVKIVMERDALWKQAETVQGVEKAILLGKGLDRMGPGVASYKCYQGVVEAMQKADPKDQSGYVGKYRFQAQALLGKVLEMAGKQQYAEAELELKKWIANPRLTLRQQQEVYGAWFALYQRWPEKKDSAKEVLAKMKSVDPNSDLGIGAGNR